MRKRARPKRAVDAAEGAGGRHGLARALSRMGVCSRADAIRRIIAGRVRVNGAVVRDPELPITAGRDAIAMDGREIRTAARVCVLLNKPRGLVVTAHDEHGRATVYGLLQDAGLPWLAPVGRLDRASEGLLLMTNDPAWAAQITDPARRVAKVYRVQVRGRPDAGALDRLRAGIVDRGERLVAASVRIVGGGERNTWCEVVLREGRNRELRRMFGALGHEVLRLLRTAIGPVMLGQLPQGAWRMLDDAEVAALAAPTPVPAQRAPAMRPGGRPRSRSRQPRGSRRPR